jgi:hypothetical protein
MDALTEVQPIRFPRFWFWIPFAVNVGVILSYLGFVVAPWLGWFADHGTGPCYVDTGCQGPDTIPVPDPVAWLLTPLAVVIFIMVASGPVLTGILGASTVLVTGLRLRSARTGRRVATLVSGLALLGLAAFQLTPMGQMFAAWVID